MPPVSTTSKKERECQKCVMHGVHEKVKGHKFSCFYRDCTCQRCQIVNMKRQKNRLVIAQKRRLDLNKDKNEEAIVDHKIETSDSSDAELQIDMTDSEIGRTKSPPIRRAVYCRRCQVHGIQTLLKGHKDKCAFKGCWCAECRILIENHPGHTTGSQYNTCNHCKFNPTGIHMPTSFVNPYPPPLYRMPPLLLPHQNYSNSGGNGNLFTSHHDYQPQVPRPMYQDHITSTYESSLRFTSLLNRQELGSQTSPSMLPSCLPEGNTPSSIQDGPYNTNQTTQPGVPNGHFNVDQGTQSNLQDFNYVE